MTDDLEDHDRGLAFDLGTLGRRRALLLLGGAGLAALTGCGSDSNGTQGTATATASTPATTSNPTTGATATSGDCDEIPEETAGPYPGDGSNGPNVLVESGIVRSDITSSFGDASGTAEGVPATVTLTVQDASNDCGPLKGAAVYLWHCNREGEYSLYSQAIADQNYLRGVQETDDKGQVTYTSIFPACYSGRWPHIHFEVYASLSDATSAGDPIRTSQLALPQDVCEEIYSTADGYGQSTANLSQISLDSDNVFGDDDAEHQMAAVSGNVSDGYTITLTVPVEA
jgi:protocatechuate 3,4-dioxygenase beta subunit